ncbi:phage portal protein [Spongiactinospora sp. TRM90649]|uniref:phage portal protein n=1 Tax=Spongiactinospora sp. TRM90649 TaxID=3031114 RepID=UPI0023F635F7|nr:phage portal protein [Spongiactinospora sp. TRM90649]MDF5755813.1 phage portal protein [Spongiactinospora sp. TRM90649]
MSLFARRHSAVTGPDPLIPPRPGAARGTVAVTNETALRHSAVWACLRLRANLVSTMPVDVYRRVGRVQVEVPAPPVLVTPGGERVGMLEWLYSTQFDLDRSGNTFGLITARDGLGLPARIDLVPLAEVSVIVRGGELWRYRIGGTEYTPDQVWHERQYTVAGLHVGLSPVAHAAWSIGEYLSIQEFALDWFGGGAMPAAHLKNTSKILTKDQAADVKQTFRASVSTGEVFVTGSDWEYNMLQAEQAGSDWLNAKQYGVADVARFFDCPGDLIDAAVSTGSITYASITQRNLQFLIMHLGPAIVRREDALNRLTPRPRYVKFNAGALLRMDLEARSRAVHTRIVSRTLTPNEARELEDLPPLSEEQFAEFDRLFGSANKQPTASTATSPGASS